MLVIPKKSDIIYKEECVLCFKNQVKNDLIFVILIIRKFGAASVALKVFARNISFYTIEKLHHMTSF